MRFEVTVASLLLVWLYCRLFLGSAQMGIAYDELFHIPAGVAWVSTGLRRATLDHLPLGHLLAGLALRSLEPAFDRSLYLSERIHSAALEFGYSFFAANERQVGLLLLVARTPFMLIATLGALYAYLLSRSLFGRRAGIFTLILYCFCPGILGWSRYVYLDGLLAACAIAALSHLVWFLKSRSLWQLSGFTFWFAATLGSKYSGVYLVPIATLALLVPPHWLGNVTVSLKRRVLDCAVVYLGTGLLLWALFGFPRELGFYFKGSALLYSSVPSDLLFYLHGEFKKSFWDYFLVHWFIKSTLPLVLLTCAAIALLIARGARERLLGVLEAVWPQLLLLAGAIGFLVITSYKSLPLGFRYLLPMYPPLYVLAGGVLKEAAFRRSWAVVVWGLAVWHVVESLAVYPDEMAYFNELAGGSARGIYWANDASLDAGQNLPRLARFLRKRGNPAIRILYQGTDVPERYGIKTEFFSQKDWQGSPSPGLYAISSFPLSFQQLAARNDPHVLDWLNRMSPIAIIGNSIWVYEVRAH